MKKTPFYKKAVAIFVLLTVSLQTVETHLYADIHAHQSTSDFSIPTEIGKIEEVHEGSSGKEIIYIQDAHDSLEAQENIARAIDLLVAKHGVKTVFEEGYEGIVPTDEYFGGIKDRVIKEKVSYYFLDKLRIGGAEYAHINRKQDFRLIGADNIKMHMENVSWYREAALYEKVTKEDLKEIHHEIEQWVQARFPKDFKVWLKLKARSEAHEISLFDYLNRTMSGQGMNREKYPVLSLLLQAGKSESPALLEQARHIDGKTLFEEIDRFENDYAASFLTSETDRKIFQYHKAINLLKRLSDIEMTYSEYATVKTYLESFSTQNLAEFLARQTKKSMILPRQWEGSIRHAVRFYELAKLRDETVREKIEDWVETSTEDTAAIVFGGFHKEQIRQYFKELGISYVIVSPQMQSQDPFHKAAYRDLMLRDYSRFEIPALVKQAATPPRGFELALAGGPAVRAELLEQIQQVENAVLRVGDLQEEENLRDAIDQALAQNMIAASRSEVRTGKTLADWQKEPGVEIIRGGKYSAGSSDEERLALVDERGMATGESAPKTEVHEKGLLHQTSHGYFFYQGKILLQIRSAQKKTSAGKFQVSASGHVNANETPFQGFLRETVEETGLSLNEGKIRAISKENEIYRDYEISEGRNREFTTVYSYELDEAELETLKTNYNLNEVDAFWLIPIPLFVRMIKESPGLFSGSLQYLFKERSDLYTKMTLAVQDARDAESGGGGDEEGARHPGNPGFILKNVFKFLIWFSELPMLQSYFKIRSFEFGLYEKMELISKHNAKEVRESTFLKRYKRFFLDYTRQKYLAQNKHFSFKDGAGHQIAAETGDLMARVAESAHLLIIFLPLVTMGAPKYIGAYLILNALNFVTQIWFIVIHSRSKRAELETYRQSLMDGSDADKNARSETRVESFNSREKVEELLGEHQLLLIDNNPDADRGYSIKSYPNGLWGFSVFSDRNDEKSRMQTLKRFLEQGDFDADYQIEFIPAMQGQHKYAQFNVEPRLVSSPKTFAKKLRSIQKRSEVRTENFLSPMPFEAYPADATMIFSGEVSASVAEQVLRKMKPDVIREFNLPEPINLQSIPLKAGAFGRLAQVEVASGQGKFVMEVPTSANPRRFKTVRNNYENFKYYAGIGRTRFLPKAYFFYEIPYSANGVSSIPAGISEFIPELEELNFGYGTLRRWVVERRAPFATLPRGDIPDVLAEIIAAITYHYEPEVNGGTSLANVFVNSGDFIYRRKSDGSPEIRLITARERKTNVPIPEFIHALIELQTMEEIQSDEEKIEGGEIKILVPAMIPISNPSVAFHGLVRGLTYLYQDLKVESDAKQKAQERARVWLTQFAASDFGRPYQDEVNQFLAGNLPLVFGEKKGEGWPSLESLRGILSELTEMSAEAGMPSYVKEFLSSRIKDVRERMKYWVHTPKPLTLEDMKRSIDAVLRIPKYQNLLSKKGKNDGVNAMAASLLGVLQSGAPRAFEWTEVREAFMRAKSYLKNTRDITEKLTKEFTANLNRDLVRSEVRAVAAEVWKVPDDFQKQLPPGIYPGALLYKPVDGIYRRESFEIALRIPNETEKDENQKKFIKGMEGLKADIPQPIKKKLWDLRDKLEIEKIEEIGLLAQKMEAAVIYLQGGDHVVSKKEFLEDDGAFMSYLKKWVDAEQIMKDFAVIRESLGQTDGQQLLRQLAGVAAGLFEVSEILKRLYYCENDRKAQRMLEAGMEELERLGRKDSGIKENLQEIRRKITMIGMDLPMFLFAPNDVNGARDVRRIIQISFRREAIIFSNRLLAQMDPQADSHKKFIAFYLLVALHLIKLYKEIVKWFDYEAADKTGEVWQGIQQRMQRLLKEKQFSTILDQVDLDGLWVSRILNDLEKEDRSLRAGEENRFKDLGKNLAEGVEWLQTAAAHWDEKKDVNTQSKSLNARMGHHFRDFYPRNTGESDQDYARRILKSMVQDVQKIAFYRQNWYPGAKNNIQALYNYRVSLQKIMQKVDMVGIFPLNVQFEIIFALLHTGDLPQFERELDNLLSASYTPQIFRDSQRGLQGSILKDGQWVPEAGRILALWLHDALPVMLLILQSYRDVFREQKEIARISTVEKKLQNLLKIIRTNQKFEIDLRATKNNELPHPLLVPIQRWKREEDIGFIWRRIDRAKEDPTGKSASDGENIDIQIEAHRDMPNGRRDVIATFNFNVRFLKNGEVVASADQKKQAAEAKRRTGLYVETSQQPSTRFLSPLWISKDYGEIQHSLMIALVYLAFRLAITNGAKGFNLKDVPGLINAKTNKKAGYIPFKDINKIFQRPIELRPSRSEVRTLTRSEGGKEDFEIKNTVKSMGAPALIPGTAKLEIQFQLKSPLNLGKWINFLNRLWHSSEDFKLRNVKISKMTFKNGRELKKFSGHYDLKQTLMPDTVYRLELEPDLRSFLLLTHQKEKQVLSDSLASIFQSNLSGDPATRILVDLGAGRGGMAKKFVDQGLFRLVHAVDKNEEAIAYLREQDSRILIHRKNFFEGMPKLFNGGGQQKADVVLASHSFYSPDLQDRIRVIHEAADLLKDNDKGMFAIVRNDFHIDEIGSRGGVRGIVAEQTMWDGSNDPWDAARYMEALGFDVKIEKVEVAHESTHPADVFFTALSWLPEWRRQDPEIHRRLHEMLQKESPEGFKMPGEIRYRAVSRQEIIIGTREKRPEIQRKTYTRAFQVSPQDQIIFRLPENNQFAVITALNQSEKLPLAVRVNIFKGDYAISDFQDRKEYTGSIIHTRKDMLAFLLKSKNDSLEIAVDVMPDKNGKLYMVIDANEPLWSSPGRLLLENTRVELPTGEVVSGKDVPEEFQFSHYNLREISHRSFPELRWAIKAGSRDGVFRPRHRSEVREENFKDEEAVRAAISKMGQDFPKNMKEIIQSLRQAQLETVIEKIQTKIQEEQLSGIVSAYLSAQLAEIDSLNNRNRERLAKIILFLRENFAIIIEGLTPEKKEASAWPTGAGAGIEKDKSSLILPQTNIPIPPVQSIDKNAIDKEFNALSLAEVDRALDAAYAVKVIKTKNFMTRDPLQLLKAWPEAVSVLTGTVDISPVKRRMSQEDYEALKQLFYIINQMLATSIDIVLLDADKYEEAVILDRDKISKRLPDEFKKYPKHYGATEQKIAGFDLGVDYLILHDMLKKKGFFFETMARQAEIDSTKERQVIELLENVMEGKNLPRRIPNPVTELVFPSAREAAILEKSIRSHLDAMRSFGRSFPNIWVFDDLHGAMAEEKRDMLQRLAGEYNAVFRYVGDEEKEKFLNQVTGQDNRLDVAGIKAALFPPGTHGANRNWVQVFLQGKIYSTVDDDSYSHVTRLAGLSKGGDRWSRERKLGFLHVDFIKAVPVWLATQPANISEDMIEKWEKIIKEQVRDKDKRSPIFVARIYQIHRMIEKDAQIFKPVLKKTFEQLSETMLKVLTEMNLLEANSTLGNEWLYEEDITYPLQQNDKTVVIPVDAYGVHGNAIGQQTEDLTAPILQSHRDGPNEIRSTGKGRVGLVDNHVNLTGAGAVGKDLSQFIRTKDNRSLFGYRHERFIKTSPRDFASNLFYLGTTTMTTIDNRKPAEGENLGGIISPGLMDSRPLGAAVKRGNRQRFLFISKMTLDHERLSSQTRYPDMENFNATDYIARLVQESLDGIAPEVYYGNITFRQGILEIVHDLLGYYRDLEKISQQSLLEVTNLATRAQIKKQKETAEKLLRAIDRQLAVPFLSLEQVDTLLQTYMRKKTKSPLLIGSKISRKGIQVASLGVVEHYLSDPTAKADIEGMLNRQIKKIDDTVRLAAPVLKYAHNLSVEDKLPYMQIIPALPYKVSGAPVQNWFVSVMEKIKQGFTPTSLPAKSDSQKPRSEAREGGSWKSLAFSGILSFGLFVPNLFSQEQNAETLSRDQIEAIRNSDEFKKSDSAERGNKDIILHIQDFKNRGILKPSDDPDLYLETAIDLRPDQQALVKSGNSLEFGSGFLYNGLSGLDQIIKENQVSGKRYFSRNPVWALGPFINKEESPAIVIIDALEFNRWLRRGEAKLDLHKGQGLPFHIADSYPQSLKGYPLDAAVQIWIDLDTHLRYLELLNQSSSNLADNEKDFKEKLRRLYTAGRIKTIPFSREDKSKDQIFRSLFKGFSKTMKDTELLKKIPPFREKAPVLDPSEKTLLPAALLPQAWWKMLSAYEWLGMSMWALGVMGSGYLLMRKMFKKQSLPFDNQPSNQEKILKIVAKWTKGDEVVRPKKGFNLKKSISAVSALLLGVVGKIEPEHIKSAFQQQGLHFKTKTNHKDVEMAAELNTALNRSEVRGGNNWRTYVRWGVRLSVWSLVAGAGYGVYRVIKGGQDLDEAEQLIYWAKVMLLALPVTGVAAGIAVFLSQTSHFNWRRDGESKLGADRAKIRGLFEEADAKKKKREAHEKAKKDAKRDFKSKSKKVTQGAGVSMEKIQSGDVPEVRYRIYLPKLEEEIVIIAANAKAFVQKFNQYYDQKIFKLTAAGSNEMWVLYVVSDTPVKVNIFNEKTPAILKRALDEAESRRSEIREIARDMIKSSPNDLTQIIQKAGPTKFFVDASAKLSRPFETAAELVRLKRAGAEVVLYNIRAGEADSELMRILNTFPQTMFKRRFSSLPEALQPEKFRSNINLVHYSEGEISNKPEVETLMPTISAGIIYIAGKPGSGAYAMNQLAAIKLTGDQLKQQLQDIGIEKRSGYLWVSEEKAGSMMTALSLQTYIAFAQAA